METTLAQAVVFVLNDEQWFIQKHLLCFGLTNPVLLFTLTAVAFVPIEPFNAGEIDHVYMIAIYVPARNKAELRRDFFQNPGSGFFGKKLHDQRGGEADQPKYQEHRRQI